jgi:transposase
VVSQAKMAPNERHRGFGGLVQQQINQQGCTRVGLRSALAHKGQERNLVVGRRYGFGFIQPKRNEPHKFVVLPKRWIVERTFAWISRNRRLARDFERYATTVAMIRIMLRRLTRPTLCP